MPQPVNVPVVAGTVVIQNGKVLLVQEKQASAFGKWNLPGGHVDMGETIEEAAIRETKEETGYIVELDQALPIIHEAADRAVLHAFAAHITSGELHFPSDEFLDAKWFTPSDIRVMSRDLRSTEYILGALDALNL